MTIMRILHLLCAQAVSFHVLAEQPEPDEPAPAAFPEKGVHDDLCLAPMETILAADHVHEIRKAPFAAQERPHEAADLAELEELSRKRLLITEPQGSG